MKQCVLNYQIYKNYLLGKGGFGSVYLAKNELNLEYACKIISLQSNQKNYIKIKQLVERELSIMSSLDNPSIVKMSHSFYDGKNIYIFMEFCNGGDLKQKVRKLQINQPQIQISLKKFENLALDVFWDVLDALSYLYTRNIIHRDIKLENVLIHNGKYKLSDFGLSKILIDIDEEPMNSILGTPCYQSPQILRNQIYSPKTDIWSFGVLLYEIIMGGRLPFKGCNASMMLKDIEQKLQSKHFSKIANFLQHQLQFLENKLLYYLIQNMLVVDEDKRISLKELLRQVNTYRQNLLTLENEKLQITETRCRPYYQQIQKQTIQPIQQQQVQKKKIETVPFRFRIVEKTHIFEQTFVSKLLDQKISLNYLIVLIIIILYILYHKII